MHEPGSLPPSSPSPSSARERSTSPSRPCWKGVLRSGILIGTALILLLSVWVLFLQTRPKPLRADANTLYLVTSPEDLSISSLPAQWHWQELGGWGALVEVAPYHPTGEALEIDAQISDSGASFQNDDVFGIVVGMNSQGAGYVCGMTLNKPIASYPGWDEHTIQREATTGVYGSWSRYVTVTVTIRDHVITLFYDGKQVARATVAASPADGLIGLFTSSSATVRGFRVEHLP